MYELDKQDECECAVPQKYVERFNLPVYRNVRTWPPCVLLHRCLPTSGCCTPPMTCGPSKIDVVHIPFMVFTIYDLRASLEPTEAFFYSFVNHTQCACQLEGDVPRYICDKKCPEPFQKTFVGPTCLCECLSNGKTDNKFCKEIKGGARTLPAQAAECVRSGGCYKPLCEVGEFNAATGYCPLSDDYALPAHAFGDNPSMHRHYRAHLRLPERPTSISNSSATGENVTASNSSATGENVTASNSSATGENVTASNSSATGENVRLGRT
ncbi:hypothetical protein EGW08_022019 [Elysia chlorotica]|uniref:Platelet-derived growth factor (PDGF) family profile domain-containing protein n=1 Tax=Elysia chlorotica TaxID=188477 RepID=A0A433SM18_ELYCH|nr:hypothetical protein EGW08_022019 [Elysia chlorotica]